jgi:hypothetical protein
MHSFEQVLAGITPRAASVTLLLFDRVVARYEASGKKLDERERAAVLSILRSIARRDRAT